MANPIPVRLRGEFQGFMDAHNIDDLPDGAWWCHLEEAAETFIKQKKLKWADSNGAVHQYLKMLGATEI